MIRQRLVQGSPGEQQHFYDGGGRERREGGSQGKRCRFRQTKLTDESTKRQSPNANATTTPRDGSGGATAASIDGRPAGQRSFARPCSEREEEDGLMVGWVARTSDRNDSDTSGTATDNKAPRGASVPPSAGRIISPSAAAAAQSGARLRSSTFSRRHQSCPIRPSNSLPACSRAPRRVRSLV